ncbi:MAG: hypothetical protein HEQ23_15875 [Tepidisphaera sp.]
MKPGSTTPACRCGYDLAGLDGPPWVCPECNRKNWPLPEWVRRERRIGLSPLEKHLFWKSVWVMVAGAAVGPWLPFPLMVVCFSAAVLGVLVMSATWSLWLVKGDKGWAKAAALPMFGMCVVVSGCVAFAIGAGSSVLAIALWGPR